MKKQPKNRIRGIQLLGAATIAIVTFAALMSLPARTSAGSLNTSVVGMFPKNIGEFGYADLKSARKLTWWPQIREQIIPSRFREFEKFLSSAGIDPNAQVEEMAWAGITVKGGGEEVVGIALGTFDPSSTEARFKTQKMSMTDIRGYHVFTFGSGTGANDIQFFFIDSNTAAFGHHSALEKMIGVRFGDYESLLTNDAIFPLINEANGGGIIWAVLDKSYTHLAMTQLVPQVSQFPQAAAIVDRLHAMTINIDADSGVDAKLQAVCDSPDDANLLAAGLQAGLMYRRYQEASTNPDLARLLDNVHVSPAGDRLKIEVPVSEEQITALIKSRVFAVPM